MDEQHKYRATDRMSDLICGNYALLLVMSRFGLSLGFGDKSVEAVCRLQGVDYKTFLAVINFIGEEHSRIEPDSELSVSSLMSYLKFYDEYVSEVRRHMDYEDKMVFTYVDALLKGGHTSGYRIGTFARKHDQIETKLTELKNIIIRYYPANGNNNLLNAALFDIYSREQDLASHCRVEDYMFIPAVLKMEKELGKP